MNGDAPLAWTGPVMDAFGHGSPFPPIGQYAFLSDTETTALIAPSGNVEWLCLPRMDSPSVFGALLDRDAGSFRFGPSDLEVPADRRYLPGTMVLETTWGSSTGWVIVRDVLLMGPWARDQPSRGTHRRAPTDYDAEHMLFRTIRCVNGQMQLQLLCEPAFDYGRTRGTWRYADDSFFQGTCRAGDGDLELTLTSDLRLGFEGPKAIARAMIKEGETRFCVLSWGYREPPRTGDEGYQRLVWTAHHWQHWLARGRFPDHPWRSALERSALTLKGLTFAPTGAIVAAATTSLPETPGGERNWDYRYTWIRDSTFALWALYTLGFDWEATDFLYFIADAVSGQEALRVMYTVDGSPVPGEQTVPELGGYDGARPVRIGNAANGQRQHDVWGALLDSMYLHTRSRDALDDRIWSIVVAQVEAALAHWREPDRGIWETRGEPRHFTSSKVMCWVAADRGARLARIRGEHDLETRWAAAAQEIRAEVCERAVDERGVFTQHYDTTALDASALLIPLVRFLPPDDPRIRATVQAVAQELSDDGLVRRYRVDETDDGLSGEEGTFTICSFWLVSAYVEIGELDRARRLLEKLLSFASPLGLYGEEIDAQTGRQLGNFPQAFTHLALINAVMRVIKAERDRSARWVPLPVPSGEGMESVAAGEPDAVD
jgi:GH15 family glucan-1,4-alpha-glucosidase